MILTWFYYLSFLENRKKTTNKNKIKIFISKVTYRKFTTTKAPMAHKNWSKEQYQFSYFNFKVSTHFTFKKKMKNSQSFINNYDVSVLIALITKNYVGIPETNIFSAKNYKFNFQFSDKIYFNYFKSIS